MPKAVVVKLLLIGTIPSPYSVFANVTALKMAGVSY